MRIFWKQQPKEQRIEEQKVSQTTLLVITTVLSLYAFFFFPLSASVSITPTSTVFLTLLDAQFCLGYTAEGKLGGSFSASNPPPGKAFAGYAKGCTGIVWEESKTSILFEKDWQWCLSDNPEYASQAGNHKYAHLLQDLSPIAFETRRVHNLAMLAEAKTLVAEFNSGGGSEGVGEGEGITPIHLVLFMQSIEDELTAFELGCHLYPVNSIGYGGVRILPPTPRCLPFPSPPLAPSLWGRARQMSIIYLFLFIFCHEKLSC